MAKQLVMAQEAFKYATEPEDEATAESAWQTIQTCREVYNHALTQEYKPASEHDKPSYTAMQNKLPEWKHEWSEWASVYSKYLHALVKDIVGELENRSDDVFQGFSSGFA